MKKKVIILIVSIGLLLILGVIFLFKDNISNKFQNYIQEQDKPIPERVDSTYGNLSSDAISILEENTLILEDNDILMESLKDVVFEYNSIDNCYSAIIYNGQSLKSIIIEVDSRTVTVY